MKLFGNKKRISMSVAMAILVTVVGLIIVFSSDHVQADFFAVTTSIVNIVLFTVMLAVAVWKYPFSFDMMFWVFNLFFFGYAPLLQHLTNIYAWNLHPIVEQVSATNLMILLWSVCYIIGSKLGEEEPIRALIKTIWVKMVDLCRKPWIKLMPAWRGSRVGAVWTKCANFPLVLLRRLIGYVKRGCWVVVQWLQNHTGKKTSNLIRKFTEKNAAFFENKRRLNPRMRAMDVMLGMSMFILLCNLVFVGLENMFLRSTAGFKINSIALSLLTIHGFSNILLYTAALFVIRMKQLKRLDIRAVIAAICFLLCCFPTAMPRNMMASFYGGLMIILISQTRKGRWFNFVIVGGLVLVFPFLEVFRYLHRLQEVGFVPLLKQCFAENYLAGHYDAHQMFISVQNYVQKFGITWGRQLLGALLFFVPRAIWTTKPVGTGHTVIAALEQFSFTNVSAPMVAEGYINFGTVGVMVFAVILGMLVREVDRRYWANRDPLSLVRMLYPFAMFQFFFLLRGDMMSAWAFMFAQLFVGMVIWLCVIYRTRYLKAKKAE